MPHERTRAAIRLNACVAVLAPVRPADAAIGRLQVQTAMRSTDTVTPEPLSSPTIRTQAPSWIFACQSRDQRPNLRTDWATTHPAGVRPAVRRQTPVPVQKRRRQLTGIEDRPAEEGAEMRRSKQQARHSSKTTNRTSTKSSNLCSRTADSTVGRRGGLRPSANLSS